MIRKLKLKDNGTKLIVEKRGIYKRNFKWKADYMYN